MIIDENAKSLEEKVYLSLEDAILSGEYRRGDALTEMSLCKRLGVSRTPVRSALHRLSEEGLIEISPNRGAVVVCMNNEDLADIYKIRMRLEGLASAMVAKRMSAVNIIFFLFFIVYRYGNSFGILLSVFIIKLFQYG